MRSCARPIVVGFALLLTNLLSGCGTLGYYAQAARGEVAVLGARLPLQRVVADPRTPERTRHALALVTDARAFAARELHLPVGGRFDTFADLGRKFVVWNVYAAPALSLNLRQWCYPIAGCAVYRGYFAEGAARDYGARLAARGWDVDVSGVVAYSTLGWFDDPVLSTFVAFADFDLLGLIFHELAHGRIYVPGDSRFNESFATFVEEEGLARWFAAHPDASGLLAYQRSRAVRGAFLTFMLDWRERFAALYDSPLPATEKLQRKAELVAGLRAAYADSLQPFRGRYDAYIDAGFNNARLATVAAYHDWEPAFRALRGKAADWPAFYREVEVLAHAPPAERERRLTALLTAAP